MSYAQLTDDGYETLRKASRSHVAGVRRLFVERFSDEELADVGRAARPAPGCPSARAPARCTDVAVTADLPTAAEAGVSIDAATALGAVSLTVSDLGRAQAFYEQVLGLVPAPAARRRCA